MNNLFVTVCCFILLGLCHAEDRDPRSEAFKAFIAECKTQTKATEEDVTTIIHRKNINSTTGWCMFACIKKKSGVFNEKNEIVIEKLKESMAPLKTSNAELYEKIVAIVSECKTEKEAEPEPDECKAAERIGKCVYKKKAKAGIK